MRDVLFVSHANPEDNEFALWLTLRLAAEGYAVWCDLTDLLGGEDFWRDADQTLRNKTGKYLYVLSKSSNTKEGVLLELAVANGVRKKHSLKDFIIPLHIDDLSHFDTNIEAFRVNSIDFHSGWANGLARLLKKLSKDEVEKNKNFGPSAVSSWWRERFSADSGLIEEPEELFSNWFSVSAVPNKLYVHVFQPGYSVAALQPSQHPIHEYANGVITFAPAADFGIHSSIFWQSTNYRLDELLQDKHKLTFLDARTSQNVISSLLRQAWERALESKGLQLFELASGDQCAYPLKDQIPKDTLSYDLEGFKGRRQMVGYKTINKKNEKKRHWHFGVSGRVYVRSETHLAINPHVLFSDDGNTIWTSSKRMHRAKMSQCKDWWNDEWRDRILAMMSFLAEEGKIKLQLSGDDYAEVSPEPKSFVCPVLFHDPADLDEPEEEDFEDGDVVLEDPDVWQ